MFTRVFSSAGCGEEAAAVRGVNKGNTRGPGRGVEEDRGWEGAKRTGFAEERGI